MTLAGLALAAPAEAATFNVTNLNDSGAGSLRQAVLDANAAAGADTITFQAGLTGTITLTSGQIDVTDSVDIQGPGAAALSVSGNNASRVFYLYAETELIDVTISGLTITGGFADDGGGIIDFDENLTLNVVVLTGNHATGATGGGLWMSGSSFSATLRGSTISGNTSSLIAGGVYVGDTGGPLLFQRTTITGNLAGQAGGVYFLHPDHEITFEDSTISNNTSGGVGGGIYLDDAEGGAFTLSRTTISGNSSPTGGGAYFNQLGVPLIIEDSTISGNHAIQRSGGGLFLDNLFNGSVIRSSTIANNTAVEGGGGIELENNELTLVDTLVADNSLVVVPPAGPPVGNDLGGVGLFNARYSLIENPGSATINDNGGNLFHQDPQLGPLQNNGGLTETQRPAGTSPVINAGDPAFTPPPASDQRGFFLRVAAGRIDIGAVELQDGELPSASVPTLGALGKALLASLLGAGGWLLMRRRRASPAASP
ncbi:MAG TPA: choice-of-anchor Q domain-containing protein [Thermoanaerobaculia bacterium]